jgi:hypothetical protein
VYRNGFAPNGWDPSVRARSQPSTLKLRSAIILLARTATILYIRLGLWNMCSKPERLRHLLNHGTPQTDFAYGAPNAIKTSIAPIRVHTCPFVVAGSERLSNEYERVRSASDACGRFPTLFNDSGIQRPQTASRSPSDILRTPAKRGRTPTNAHNRRRTSKKFARSGDSPPVKARKGESK